MHASQSSDFVAASFSWALLILVAPACSNMPPVAAWKGVSPALLPLRLNLNDAFAVAFAFAAAGPVPQSRDGTGQPSPSI